MTQPTGIGALERRRHVAVLVLALNSGATDALGFLALGGAFTSVMTGNMVLAGVGTATADTQLLLLAAGAIVCFCLGCAVGARLAGAPQAGDPVWPTSVTLAVTLQLIVTIAFATGWWWAGSDPDKGTAVLLLGISATGLGIQSSAVQRFGVSGLSTTYLTGTLTTFVIGLALRRRTSTSRHGASILGALLFGAALGAATVRLAPPVAPAVPLVSLLLVVLISLRIRRTQRAIVSSVRSAAPFVDSAK